MGVSWTREQQQVIDLRDRNILVSAAAGSGKTAVLVERIIHMITDGAHPVDIDRLLIVTFTNAAASEMRERIGNAIEKELLAHPGNEHLQRQTTLIHNAQITTIDSFCLYVIRNHFHEIGLEPNFRIGDEGELKLLKEDVLKQVLLRNYEEMQEPFTALVDGFSPGRSDARVSEMILTLYEFSRSYPWPKEWLDTCVQGYGIRDVKELSKVVWMQPLVENIRGVLADIGQMTRDALALATESDGPDRYEQVLRNDLQKYEAAAQRTDFAALYEALTNMTYDRLPSSRGFLGDADKLAQVKALRDEGKSAVKKLCRQYFFAAPEVMVQQLNKAEPFAAELVRLAEEFAEAFAEEKRRKNLVDFHDLEHFALDILVDGETKQSRRAAEEFRDTFAEIMIDEYQDSNYVQETILRAISTEARGRNNIFMVGDVKQSIYRFRLARPELFMEKYDTYDTAESATQRIDLHKNFRSREEVLSFTNDIFYQIMGRDLGNVQYDGDAALYPGASYAPCGQEDMFAPEILLADSSDELTVEYDSGDKKLMEAKLAAERIRAMMGEQLVTDKETGELRRVRYSDIVILLRSLSGWADAFASVLNDVGIPAHTLSATGYFSAVEVQTVLSMLRILDNPRQDIPLAAVLRSPMVGMSDEELALLRLRDADAPFHAVVLARCKELLKMQEVPPGEKKLCAFYRQFVKLRGLVPDLPIHELIEFVLKETGYGRYAAAMPAGKRRSANLRMLIEKAIAYERTSYKGLFHFVRYIDELQKYDVDFGEADLTGENEDVVRIMSIHKSKGLEFPVVFVCGMGKSFNRQDVRSPMVLHPELGMGLDCMDGKRRIKSPTIAKKAIAKKIDLENLGEELRVLYVALTRAKEKLIITGSRKDAAEALAQVQAEYESAVHQEHMPLSYRMREGASGYLDWLLPALAAYHGRYGVRIVPAEELVTQEIRTQVIKSLTAEDRIRSASGAPEELMEELNERFSFRYPHAEALERRNKYSVSELKHRAMREKLEKEEEELVPVFAKEELVPYVPAFMRKIKGEQEEINRGALRGTAVHRFMECYQFASTLGPAEQMERMLDEKLITKEMCALVKLSLVEEFLRSDAGVRMRAADAAGRLYREKPFVMGFTAAELTAAGFGEADATKPGSTPGADVKTKDAADGVLEDGAGIPAAAGKVMETGCSADADDLTLNAADADGVLEDGAGIAAAAGKVTETGCSADADDLTLIQGIIDVFWVEDDGIVVLDYKTDRVEHAKQLADRYGAQLRLYGEALERIFDRGDGEKLKVKERLLYSFRLGEVIAV